MKTASEADKILIEPMCKQVNIFLVGPGHVGSRLLEQINRQASILKDKDSLEIRIVAIANTKKMSFDFNGIDISNWEKILSESTENTDLNIFVEKIFSLASGNKIFIDCTASDQVVSKYKEILESGISIVTPNKKANSGNYEFYDELRKIAKEKKVKFLYETNVGAALPVIGTLRDLLYSGDEILEIKGILSGALSYIFNSYTNGKPFSQIVKDAQLKGYTEPDPREDMNGLDVARKLLILSREIGLKIELEDIEVENLVPEEIGQNGSVENFFEKLKKYDKYFEERRNEAFSKGKVLKYVATLSNGKIKAGLEEINPEHSFYNLSGSDNIFSIRTKYYDQQPLVIKGPGAGTEVTAAGVLSDLIKVSNYLN